MLIPGTCIMIFEEGDRGLVKGREISAAQLRNTLAA
jgi:hypothetical protein